MITITLDSTLEARLRSILEARNEVYRDGMSFEAYIAKILASYSSNWGKHQ